MATADSPSLAGAIVAYLKLHPDAADNAVGVQSWWLPRQFADRSLSEVEAALAALVGTGVLSEVSLPDGSTLFAANRDRERKKP